jgi:RNA polymerase sigma-70 factor (ECF subfamily)
MSDATQQAVAAVMADVMAESYGRLLACLGADFRDLNQAEDALADAVERALTAWPVSGVPRKPEAWLLTAARRRMIDGHRRSAVAERAEPALRMLADEHNQAIDSYGNDNSTIPDKRLELLFVCAHPAIDRTVRAPLMLQTVLGIDAARIASAFLTSPATMSQRLVRAKRKIADAGIAFQFPTDEELPARLGAVHDAIYAGFTTGSDRQDSGTMGAGLAAEAIYLAQLVADLLGHPESHGLHGLMLFSHSRRRARRDDQGRFVPLADQDISLWDGEMIAAGEAAMAKAAEAGPPGPYLIEAMIQGCHASRVNGTAVDWSMVAKLYDTLLLIAPSVGAEVARAAAILEAEGPEAALALLDAVEHPRRHHYQPWWAVRAHALSQLGSPDTEAAVLQAAGLTEDAAVRTYLLGLLDEPPPTGGGPGPKP